MTIATPRELAFYDTECYPNYWLLKLKPRDGVTQSFRIFAGQSFDHQQLAAIRAAFETYTTVSFNGNNYDVPMISGALMGFTVKQLKWLNDQLIVHKQKHWEMELVRWEPADHIDVMEVAPGAGGLKQYAARIHYHTIRDLPYDPGHTLEGAEFMEVDSYCENDLDSLAALYDSLRPQVEQRVRLSARYGIDLRSKSDAQLAEAVLRVRCQHALGRKIYKPEVDWGMQFQYRVPPFIAYASPQLQRALELVREAVFRLDHNGNVAMPPQLENLEIAIGNSVYTMGIGGLHSQEKKLVVVSDEHHQVQMPDVASYYPSLMLNSGEYPPAMGRAFAEEFGQLKAERLAAKAKQGQLKKAGTTNTPEYHDTVADNEGGKIMINGTFGKTGSPYSVLFAPTMLMQTTITGQLSLLMLIEWLEHYGIPVVSANTDGLVTKCPRPLLTTCNALIDEWQRRTGLEMEIEDYRALYARDVNSYFAISAKGDVKRKGEYAKAGLLEKKNPDVEICSDAVAALLANGTPLRDTIFACRDIRKFVTIQKVAGGGVKLWGEGPRKDARVRDMVPVLEVNGWLKAGRQWTKIGIGTMSAQDAYKLCFAPQRPEYLGKVVRWYYGTQSPGPIVYATNGNTVSLSYGSCPCMTLPSEFPADVDFDWYIKKAESILVDIGYFVLHN